MRIVCEETMIEFARKTVWAAYMMMVSDIAADHSADFLLVFRACQSVVACSCSEAILASLCASCSTCSAAALTASISLLAMVFSTQRMLGATQRSVRWVQAITYVSVSRRAVAHEDTLPLQRRENLG